MMKKITLLFILFTVFYSFSQTKQVTIDVTDTWVGFANWFELDNTTQVGASGWAFSDLKSEVSGSNLVVKPNYNTWEENPSDDYWTTGGVGSSVANKIFEANTYVQIDEDSGGSALEFFDNEVQFFVNVSNVTIGPDWTVKLFVKMFPADYSSLKQFDYTITSADIGSTISVTYPAGSAAAADNHFQYGLQVRGVIANPTTEASNGFVEVSPSSLSNDKFSINNFSLYPNPTNDSWTIKTNNERISSIQLYDILGKQVMNLTPNTTEAKIDATKLSKGLYFATLRTENGSSSLKLIRE